MAERKRRATPTSGGRTPREGSKFISQVFGENVRAERVRQDRLQDEVAEGMVELGHGGWSRVTVSNVERAQRTVSLDEFVALSIVLGVRPLDLLDPHDAHIDHGGGETFDPTPPGTIRGWLRGAVRISYIGRGPGRLFQVSAYGADTLEEFRAVLARFDGEGES